MDTELLWFSSKESTCQGRRCRFDPWLAWEDPMEKEMATQSCILVWEIPWTEEPGRLQFLGHKESDTAEWLNNSKLTLRAVSSVLGYVYMEINTSFWKKIWQCHVAYRILVPPPVIGLMPPVVEVQSLNHWTTREVLILRCSWLDLFCVALTYRCCLFLKFSFDYAVGSIM